MITTDYYSLFVWTGLFFCLGLINFPLTSFLFKGFIDRGYIFSKVLGMLLLSYLVWILGSLYILPFSFNTILICLALTVLLNIFILIKKGGEVFKNLPIKIIVLEEILFLILLSFWAYVRGTNPEIRGLEKFMDFGFVNSILKTKYFPPADMWLPPLKINYYYFGHAVTAILTSLSKIDSAITYNLTLATLFAFTFVCSFSLTINVFYSFFNSILKESVNLINLEKKLKYGPLLFAGFVSAFLATLGGNLHTIIYVIKSGVEKYWYPDATRYIPYTIHEFPMYSFVVSDLHGHVLDIPFVFLILSLIFAFLISGRKILLLPLSISLGISYMTNAWDLPIYLTVSGLIFLFYYSLTNHGLNSIALKKTIITSFLVLVGSVITALPFHLSFEQIAKGISFVEARSPFYQLLVLWGFPIFMTLSFLIFLFKKRVVNFFKGESLVKLFASIFDVKIQIIKERTLSYSKLFLSDIFILTLLFVSFVLILIPEIIYVKDIYIKEYHRANTMFKFVYQSFIMFSISSGYIASRILFSSQYDKESSTHEKLVKKIWFLLFAFGFTSLLIYPYFSIRSYYNSLKFYQGINGILYLNIQYPGDYAAILWMRKNISGQPTILEAVGESYTDYARISANTGIPTVLGWPVHEWLWRGSYDEAGKRTTDVSRIYESNNTNEVSELIKKYNISYIVVGSLEKDKYPKLNERNFVSLGKVVFKNGKTKIYKVNSN